MAIITDILKQVLVALVSGLLPTAPRYLPIFPFLNPQIAIDVWQLTAVLAVASGLIAYGLAQGPLPGRPSRSGLAAGALIAAILAALAMMYLADGGAMSAALFARVAFLCFFVCIAIPVGWLAARV